jgi:ATP-binding cassette subfamily B protein
MRILLEQLRTQRGPLAVVFALATVNQLLLLVEPHVLRLIVDRWVMRLDTVPLRPFFQGVATLVLAGMGIALLARVARTCQEYGANMIAQRVSTGLYARTIAHSLHLPFAVFEDQRSGELLHKIQRARQDAQTGIGQLVRLYLAGVAMLAVTTYAFYVHHFLGIAFVSLVPLLAGSVYLLSRPIRAQQMAITRAAAGVAGSTVEAIRNVELVKSLGVQRQEVERLDAANERLLALEQKKLRLVRLFTFAEGTIMNTGRASLLLVMLWLVHARAITVGEFLTLFLYAQWLFAPLSELGAVVGRYQEARATLATLDEVLDIAQETDSPQSVRTGSLEEIRLENVSLEYAGGRRAAVSAFDLVLRAGETVALVGPSGSGKSSVVKLLTALYRPSTGTITINGIDSAAVDIADHRSRIGLVTQETYLFAGTLRENLTLVRPDATDEQCIEALRRAAGMQILERGGRGLETKIGEGGLKLSGGERQRIAIARALLREPELLIFDEATSNLDPISERSITGTIRDLATSGAARITVIVAHRLSATTHADRVIVMSEGALAESGTHGSLMEKAGLYARMHGQPAADPAVRAGASTDVAE